MNQLKKYKLKSISITTQCGQEWCRTYVSMDVYSTIVIPPVRWRQQTQRNKHHWIHSISERMSAFRVFTCLYPHLFQDNNKFTDYEYQCNAINH